MVAVDVAVVVDNYGSKIAVAVVGLGHGCCFLLMLVFLILLL